MPPRLEVVHVGLAVGINAGKQRHDAGQFTEVVPSESDPRRSRHGDKMNRVIGRAAGRQEADDTVDDGAFIDDAADGRVVVAERRDGKRAPGGTNTVIASLIAVLGLMKVVPGRCRP